MLGLWEGISGPLSMRLHFAFKTSRDGVLNAPEQLRGAGIAPLGFNGEPVDEPVVLGWMPAISLYFKDPDDHSLELIHVMDEAPDTEFGIAPYSDWVARLGQ